MAFLGIVAVIAVLMVIGWLWSRFTESVETKVGDVTDRALFGAHRQAADHLGSTMLTIRSSMPSSELWRQLAYRLDVPTGKSKYSDTLYIAGEVPSTKTGNYAMRVDWSDCVQSIVSVTTAENGVTECDHTMLRWVDRGSAMRTAAPKFQDFRAQLVEAVKSIDRHAVAVLVDEHDHEVPFSTTREVSS